ncbi:MAG TPA: hypothetical protein VGH65_07805, partial [Verrucomicrobiaceae bacterium]
LLRTMELVLGLPSMNRFDRTATPMSACFNLERDERPFDHLENRIPLDELNPPLGALRGVARKNALACNELNWTEADRADATTVTRTIWALERPRSPFPWSKFHPAEDADDD